jgi:hypothetical protein
LINGSQPSSAVTVRFGATLGGTGTLGSLSVAGFVSPGGPRPGRLQSGNAVFGPGSSFTVKLNGTNSGADCDQLTVNGMVDLSGSPALEATVGFASTAGDTFTILLSAGPITGTFDGLPDGANLTVDGITLEIHYLANSVILTNVPAPVPPPGRPPKAVRAAFERTSVADGQAAESPFASMPLPSGPKVATYPTVEQDILSMRHRIPTVNEASWTTEEPALDPGSC